VTSAAAAKTSASSGTGRPRARGAADPVAERGEQPGALGQLPEDEHGREERERRPERLQLVERLRRREQAEREHEQRRRHRHGDLRQPAGAQERGGDGHGEEQEGGGGAQGRATL